MPPRSAATILVLAGQGRNTRSATDRAEAMKLDPGPVPAPVKGFRYSGVHGGLKSRGRRDFALIVADRPAVCAAVFTQNRAAAAPVVVARGHVTSGRAQAIMINSGSANAST